MLFAKGIAGEKIQMGSPVCVDPKTGYVLNLQVGEPSVYCRLLDVWHGIMRTQNMVGFAEKTVKRGKKIKIIISEELLTTIDTELLCGVVYR